MTVDKQIAPRNKDQKGSVTQKNDALYSIARRRVKRSSERALRVFSTLPSRAKSIKDAATVIWPARYISESQDFLRRIV